MYFSICAKYVQNLAICIIYLRSIMSQIQLVKHKQNTSVKWRVT